MKLKSRVCFLYNVSLKFIPFCHMLLTAWKTPVKPLYSFSLYKKIQIKTSSRTKWLPVQGGFPGQFPLCCGFRGVFCKELASFSSRNESAAPGAHSRALQERDLSDRGLGCFVLPQPTGFQELAELGSPTRLRL